MTGRPSADKATSAYLPVVPVESTVEIVLPALHAALPHLTTFREKATTSWYAMNGRPSAGMITLVKPPLAVTVTVELLDVHPALPHFVAFRLLVPDSRYVMIGTPEASVASDNSYPTLPLDSA